MASETGTGVGRTGQGSWSGDRLPVAPRQRRPALIALALLLIIGGGLISAALVIRSGQKEAVIVLRQDIAEGHVLTLSDLASAQVAAPNELGVVSWSDRNRVVGMTAGVGMKRGTLLNRLAVANDPIPKRNQRKVGFSLKANQLPAEGVRSGEYVQVIYAPSPETSNRNFTPPADHVIVQNALVFTASRPRSDGSISLTLVVTNDEVTALYQWSRLDAVALATRPQGN